MIITTGTPKLWTPPDNWLPFAYFVTGQYLLGTVGGNSGRYRLFDSKFIHFFP